MIHENLFGLILSGGKSTRMGIDKGLLNYHGVPQREYLFQLLRSFCTNVFTSCKVESDVPANLNPLPDRYPLETPLNGILSAFQKEPEAGWLVVPVDMPLINKTILEFLLLHRDTESAATCFFDSDGKNPEPLIAIWESRAYPLLAEFYRDGNISPRNFLMAHKVKVLDPPFPVHLNINTPEEFEQYRSQNPEQGS